MNDTWSPTGASDLSKILMRDAEADKVYERQREKEGEVDNQSSLALVFRFLPDVTSELPPFGGGNSAVIAVDRSL